MRTAVEISMYPLAGDYRPPIQAFIDRLNTYAELHVVTNALSTQIWGDLDRVMAVLPARVRRAAAGGPPPGFFIKGPPALGATPPPPPGAASAMAHHRAPVPRR